MVVLAASLSLLTVGAGARTASTEKYLGRWNYDQPDHTTKRNIAVINTPGAPLEVPQIGDIVFSNEPGGIVGRTDQGVLLTIP